MKASRYLLLIFPLKLDSEGTHYYLHFSFSFLGLYQAYLFIAL